MVILKFVVTGLSARPRGSEAVTRCHLQSHRGPCEWDHPTVLVDGHEYLVDFQRQEFRRINRVAAPDVEQPQRKLAFRPVSPETVADILRELFSAWNTPELRTLLGAGYYDQAESVNSQAANLATIRLDATDTDA